jgi:UDP-glucose 4-epimerase
MRYLITGGSGYIGTRLVDLLVSREQTEQVTIADTRPPAIHKPRTRYERADVRDREAVRALLERDRPDALVHLAFILNPMRNEKLMYDIDVNGTHNVLEAAGSAGTPQVLVTSSASAYGAFPDNPVPLTEDDPVRGLPSFSYARDKTEADRICQLWAAKYPDRTMTIVRPCIVLGPNVDNYLVRIWTQAPFTADTGHLEQQIQFVHEDDVVDAIALLLDGGHGGAYNVAGDGTITARECAELIASPIRKMPERVYRGLASVMLALRQSESPPGSIEFTVHPWIVSNEKLKSLGWSPEHTSRETFEATMRAKGKLDGVPAGHPAAEVGRTGLEPVTSSLSSWRSPN